jgi:hypothetical protein
MDRRDSEQFIKDVNNAPGSYFYRFGTEAQFVLTGLQPDMSVDHLVPQVQDHTECEGNDFFLLFSQKFSSFTGI